MSSKHTPGPWNYQEWGRLILDSGTGSSVRLVATVALNTYRDQGSANAHLIAAAPDLLEVAQHCEELLVRYEINRIDGERIADEALTRIRAAISKATGEA